MLNAKVVPRRLSDAMFSTPGLKVALFGKVEFDSYSGELAMMHPEYEILSGDEDGDASLAHRARGADL